MLGISPWQWGHHVSKNTTSVRGASPYAYWPWNQKLVVISGAGFPTSLAAGRSPSGALAAASAAAVSPERPTGAASRASTRASRRATSRRRASTSAFLTHDTRSRSHIAHS